ncbi:MAG: NB-ARC domain-containing protein [Anaerolineae bacterium]
MADLRLFLFGTPHLEYQGMTIKLERRKALGLAAYLALADAPQSRDVLACLLWPDQDDEHARSSLRSTLRSLTSAVAQEWIQADRISVSLKSGALWVDVQEFVGLLKRGQAHDHGPDMLCAECAEFHKQAVELYTDDFLTGFHLADSPEFDNWKVVQSEWLRLELAGVQRRLSNYHAAAQHYDQAISYARRWLALDTLHEPAHRQLMRLYAGSGQRAEALRQFQQCVELLDNELATPPETETVQLFRDIQDNRSVPVAPSEPSASASICVLPPLPTLVVGREAVLASIKQRLGVGGDLRPATVIQGWPGVGKSTTVALLAHDTDIARQFPDGVLWTSLGENPDVSGEINIWAEALKLNEPGRARRVEEISAQITAFLRDKRFLLIVDDVWQADHAAPFRVGGQKCATVLTSRLNDVANALAPTAGDVYRIPLLDEEAGLELLSKLTPDTVTQQPDEARELIHDLEGLPLAIHVAGRLLNSESRLGWGVSDLLAELRSGANLLTAQAPSDMLGVRGDTSPTIAALLKRSTDLLDAETRQRFAILGLFVPKPATFHLEAMAVAWDVNDPKPIARVLVNRGLLEPVSGGRFQMHALLVLHARSLLEDEGLEA